MRFSRFSTLFLFAFKIYVAQYAFINNCYQLKAVLTLTFPKMKLESSKSIVDEERMIQFQFPNNQHC